MRTAEDVSGDAGVDRDTLARDWEYGGNTPRRSPGRENKPGKGKTNLPIFMEQFGGIWAKRRHNSAPTSAKLSRVPLQQLRVK